MKIKACLLKSGLLLGFCFMMLLHAHAQKFINGTVLDASTNQPLGEVAVFAKGTAKQTITDSIGRFQLNLNNDTGTLVFSRVGYVNWEERLDGRTDVGNILLTASSNTSLEKVIIIGYSSVKKKD